MKQTKVKLSVILVNYNSAEYTLNCIKSLKSSEVEHPFEIIVVDNASTFENLDIIKKKYPDIIFKNNTVNKGFTGGNNDGVALASGQLILILNNDTIVQKDTLQKTIDICSKSDKKNVITGFIDGQNGLPQYSGGKEPTLLYEFLRFTLFIIKYFPLPYVEKFKIKTWENNKPQYLDWATGCMFAMYKETFLTLNGFDEKIFMYFDDVEFHKRVRIYGGHIIYNPAIKITHFGGGSAKKIKYKTTSYQFKSTIYYFKKHHGFLNAVLLSFLIKITDIFLFILAIFISIFSKKWKNKLKKFLYVLIS